MVNLKLNKWPLFTVAIIAAALFTQCQKEINHVKSKTPVDPKVVQNTVAASTVADLEKMNMPATQTSKIDASINNTVTFNGGMSVEIPQGSLMLNGSIVTSGNVQIEAKVLQKQSDMIGSGITTQSYTGLLESSGMMFIECTLNGQKLDFNPNNLPSMITKIDLNKTKNLDGYIAFYLDLNGNWVPGNTIAVVVYINGQPFFRMPFNNSGWINCDRFYRYKNKCHVRCKSKNNKPENCRVFIVFNSMRSALRLYWNPIKDCFTTEGTAGVPQDEEMTLVFEYLEDGKFFAEQKTISLSESKTNNIQSISMPILNAFSNPVAVNLTEHKAKLAKIFDGE